MPPKKDEIWVSTVGSGRVVIVAVTTVKVLYRYVGKGTEASMDIPMFEAYFERQRVVQKDAK